MYNKEKKKALNEEKNMTKKNELNNEMKYENLLEKNLFLILLYVQCVVMTNILNIILADILLALKFFSYVMTTIFSFFIHILLNPLVS